MLSHSTRRWLAGLGVAGAFVAASATPAAAADSFQLISYDTLVAPGHSVLNYLYAYDPESEKELQKLTLDLDLSKVDDFATLELASGGWDCATTDANLHCEAVAGEWGVPSFDYYLTAKSDATPGQKAEIAVKANGDGKVATGSVSVTVAEGVDLQSEPEDSVDGAPGAEVGLPGTVRNGGENTAHGAVLRLQSDWLTPYVGNFSNCEYDDGLPAICRFDTDLEPGKSYKLSAPLPVKVDKTARTGSSVVNYMDWWTKDDWALIEKDPTWPMPPGKPGTGDELRLIEVGAARQSVPQTDVDRWNSFTDMSVVVTGDNGADLAAVGSTATGKAGDQVKVSAGAHNLGPALVETWREEGPLTVVEVPQGTTAVKVSEDCAPWVQDEPWNPWDHAGEPGAAKYGCIGYGDLAKGDTTTWEFTLRIDKLTGETSGKVATKLAGDPNESNNYAAITVKPGTAGNGGEGGNGGNGGGEGDGGTLPITGSNTALIAGVGALLLAAGAAGYVVSRRRKTRFVA
ncbi:LPXTG cell wall anchor domain-containing protein [Micromonospora chersina]|uniref:LPXTG-motif cell wall anchor domain-containing protein n=1 Tax=Micromonospora chersina TaxID=47854 RepID=A0A1C6VE97_9ACTN|nr:LPXTG cell wall anchor domain-containing protein [Micromonospora chersina]SCL64666.1 LPXTG-motif cell wall anchor domain-containing protein [Micromonospora chersina]